MYPSDAIPLHTCDTDQLILNFFVITKSISLVKNIKVCGKIVVDFRCICTEAAHNFKTYSLGRIYLKCLKKTRGLQKYNFE